jgi:hypothetical protein
MATKKTTKTTKTARKFKTGDVRKDGFIFGGYRFRKHKDGTKKIVEKWYSPESFQKLLKVKRDATNRLRRRNPEKYNAQTREWKKANAERYRNYRLMKGFGLSSIEYDKKLKKQKNGCAICCKPCTSGKNLAVDHCHKSGMIRGLLCSKCNLGLGLFKDDIILLATAKKYLTEHKKRPCKKPKKYPSKSRARSGR